MDSVPRLFEGATVYVIGGGPSLATFNAERIRGRGRVIAVNEVALPGAEPWRAPWADIAYWSDRRWHDWNRERLAGFAGGLRITAMGQRKPAAVAVDHWLLRDRKGEFSTDASRLCGACSGGMALNLAALLGASRCVLVAFDMRTVNGLSHGHDRHKRPSNTARYAKVFVPAIERMAPHLARAGIEVVNATPGSALKAFPIASLESLL
jgi:hypothetical protein